MKSWSPHRYKTAAERIVAEKEFAGKLASEAFRHKIVAKFLGTSAYLAWTGAFAPKSILYVVLLDSARRDRKALIGAFKDRLRASFPKTAPWTHPIQCLVLDLETFEEQFAQYPCRKI